MNPIDRNKKNLKSRSKTSYKYGKEIAFYLDILTSSQGFKINENRSKEDIFTLKQFLTAEYLSKGEIFKSLKDTEFKISWKNVSERLENLKHLGLIKKKKQSLNAQLDSRKKCYELTSVGLFYILKEIEKEDKIANIFKIYESDPLFDIFIYTLIDKNLLHSFTSSQVLWIFLQYTKKICREISTVYDTHRNFINNSKFEFPVIKWKKNLKNEEEDWNNFCDNLVGSVFPRPFPSPEGPNIDHKVSHPYVSSNYVSFWFSGAKYSIKINEQNNIAKCYINNKEIVTVSITRGSYYVTLNRVRFRNRNDYTKTLGIHFARFIKDLELQFGYTILQFFPSDPISYHIGLIPQNGENAFIEINNLANDEKIKHLVNKLYEMFKQNYEVFLDHVK